MIQLGTACQGCVHPERGRCRWCSTGSGVLGVKEKHTSSHFFFLPSNRITAPLLWYLWCKDIRLKKKNKQRYLNKPCFRPISVKGLTGFSYGQDDPLHGRAQHHLPQEGTQHGEKKERRKVQKKTEWQRGEWAAEAKRGSVPVAGPDLRTCPPCTPTAPSLHSMSGLCPRQAVPMYSNFADELRRISENIYKWRLLKNQVKLQVSQGKCLQWEFQFCSVIWVCVPVHKYSRV